MGGPVYRYDAANPSTDEVPAGVRRAFFAGEFGRGWIKPIHVNADGTPGAIDDVPVDRQAGDGHRRSARTARCYVLDYGTGYFNGDANSALYRIEYIGRRQPGADRGRQRQPDLRARRR